MSNSITERELIFKDDLLDPRNVFGEGAFLPLVELLEQAYRGIDAPKARFLYSKSPTGRIVLSRAGKRSQYEGAVQVTDGARRSEDRTFFGRIEIDGMPNEWLLRDDELVAVLAEISNDLASAVREYGLSTGSCAFCGRTLTHDTSVFVGYGPICAANYERPWDIEEFRAELERIQ